MGKSVSPTGTSRKLLQMLTIGGIGHLAKRLQRHLKMDPKTQAHFEARARILKALAHPSRLFVVEELSRGERCVCELTEMIGSDMSTVSKHLSVLRSAGIIGGEKRGAQVYYHLKMPCAMRFFECVGEALQHAAKERWDLVCSDR